jgi:hypothetical protein
MPDPCLTSHINIQENNKNYEKQAATLRSWLCPDTLNGRTLVGQTLRTLVRRLKYPTLPYSTLDLQVLLLLSLAERKP